MNKSFLIDVIFTNVPHVFSAVGIFCNDISDHCAISCVRNFKMRPPRYIYRNENLNILMHNLFLHYVYNRNLELVLNVPDVVVAWDYF